MADFNVSAREIVLAIGGVVALVGGGSGIAIQKSNSEVVQHEQAKTCNIMLIELSSNLQDKIDELETELEEYQNGP